AQFGSDAEGGEVVVPVLVDAGGLLAEEDVDEVTGAELLVAFAVQSHDRRKEFLGGHGAVPRLCGGEARVAVAARARGLTEVGKQLLTSALHGLAQGEHRVEVGAQATAVGGVTLG